MAHDDQPETPDPAIAQDAGIPGFDTISDPRDTAIPDPKDEPAEERERLDDPDREGHQTAPEGDAEDESGA